MAWYEVEADLLTPCCISESPAMGNEVETLDYVPGTALRGMLADAYMRQGGMAGDETFRRIFCQDEIRFPNLYPRECRPLPLSIYTCKHHAGFVRDEYGTGEPFHGVWDLLFEQDTGFEAKDRRDPAPACDGSPLKPQSKKWYGKDRFGNWISREGAPQILTTRTAVSAASGSALEASLHTQQELAPGASFTGLLFASDATASLDNGKRPLEFLFTQLHSAESNRLESFIAYTGRRRAGRVRLTIRLSSAPQGVAFISKISTEPLITFWPNAPDAGRHYFTMTFQSDVILIDRLLRSITALDSEGGTLEEEMGLKDVTVKVEKAFVRTRLVAGWNAVAGIFKSDDMAIAAGSTFLLSIPAEEESKLKIEAWMKKVTEEGVGLRRAEGFGDVRFDEPLHLDAAKKNGGPL